MRVKPWIVDRGEEERSGLQGKECHQTYIGETKRTLMVRLGKHKQEVMHGDLNSGIGVCHRDSTSNF